MQEQEAPTKTADKLLIIICNRLHIKKEYLKTETTFEQLGLRTWEKEDLICKIAESFLIPIDGKLLNLNVNGMYVKDTFQGHLRRIKTIWNVLQFIEGNDDVRGKPAAYNI